LGCIEDPEAITVLGIVWRGLRGALKGLTARIDGFGSLVGREERVTLTSEQGLRIAWGLRSQVDLDLAPKE
jgi:hypothetical protein